MRAYHLTAAAILFMGLNSGTPSALADDALSFRDCATCPDMIPLPKGVFTMGAPANEFRRNLVWRDGSHQRATAQHPFVKSDEGPQFDVVMDQPIAMAQTEVTYDQWSSCIRDGGCGGYLPRSEIYINGGGGATTQVDGNHPVLFVSYLDIQSYLAWLNSKSETGLYRLPTEAEWEYAARAGTQTRFAQGFEPTSDQANFDASLTERILMQARPEFIERGHPVPVDSLDAANAWGLRHMSGNASELTASCYTRSYHGWTTALEWRASDDAETCLRVVRGGSYSDAIDLLRVAWRGSVDQTHRTKHRGFRVIKDLVDVKD
ncbi:formylglycine-generating enzyme family protein [Algirhabdus cladophorae]|uniref:formylglycine-generating enzyme family protein n=1 Tax=Algirhabdus cladophorae TaxID=3377108 RepID=UPI003B845F0E